VRLAKSLTTAPRYAGNIIQKTTNLSAHFRAVASTQQFKLPWKESAKVCENRLVIHPALHCIKNTAAQKLIEETHSATEISQCSHPSLNLGTTRSDFALCGPEASTSILEHFRI
jgi:hypothetical protein